MVRAVRTAVILACGQAAGLYLLLPASLVALVSGVLNAWYFLLVPSAAGQNGTGDRQR